MFNFVKSPGISKCPLDLQRNMIEDNIRGNLVPVLIFLCLQDNISDK